MMSNIVIDSGKPLSRFNTPEKTSEELIWFKNINSLYTRQTYRDSLVSFSKFFNIKGIEDLQKVETIHIIEYRDYLKSENFKKATINTRLASLSSLFKHLIEKQLVKINPCDGIQRMKKDYQKVTSRALSESEVTSMMAQPNINTLVGLRDRAILSIMFNIGTRVGTLSKLKGKDIYEENGYLIFDMHLKGDKRNLVAVNSHIQAALRNYFEKIGYYIKDSEGNIKFDIPDDAPIFPILSNNPDLYNLDKAISTNYIYKMWQKYAKKAELERTNPHCARTTFITKALESGCDLQHVQQTAGHNDPRTTMAYNHNAVNYKNSASFRVSFG